MTAVQLDASNGSVGLQLLQHELNSHMLGKSKCDLGVSTQAEKQNTPTVPDCAGKYSLAISVK